MPISLKYYKESDSGKPILEKEFKIEAREDELIKMSTDRYWLVISVKKNIGCSVGLSRGQMLELVTIKPLSNGSSDLVTVVRILSKTFDINKDGDDVVVNPPENYPST